MEFRRACCHGETVTGSITRTLRNSIVRLTVIAEQHQSMNALAVIVRRSGLGQPRAVPGGSSRRCPARECRYWTNPCSQPRCVAGEMHLDNCGPRQMPKVNAHVLQ